MKKIFLLLFLSLSLSLFSQDVQMIFWGNGKPTVFIGTDITGSFLADQKGHNFNVIISDTCTGKMFKESQGNIWVDPDNWFVMEFLTQDEPVNLIFIETTVNKINMIVRDPEQRQLIIEGLIWNAVHLINDAYNRYLHQKYGPFTGQGYNLH